VNVKIEIVCVKLVILHFGL